MNKALQLEEFETRIKDITAAKATPFKNRKDATRIALQLDEKPITVQLSSDFENLSDALLTKFGIGLVPKENEAAPDKYRVSFSIEPESKHFRVLQALDEHLTSLAHQEENKKTWFAGWPTKNIKNLDSFKYDILTEPTKRDPDTNELMYTDYLFKVGVVPRTLQVLEMREADGKKKFVKSSWDKVKAFSHCIATVALTNMYVAGGRWGATWYLNGLVFTNNGGNKNNALDMMNLPSGIVIEEDDQVESEELPHKPAGGSAPSASGMDEPIGLEDYM